MTPAHKQKLNIEEVNGKLFYKPVGQKYVKCNTLGNDPYNLISELWTLEDLA